MALEKDFRKIDGGVEPDHPSQKAFLGEAGGWPRLLCGFRPMRKTSGSLPAAGRTATFYKFKQKVLSRGRPTLKKDET